MCIRDRGTAKASTTYNDFQNLNLAGQTVDGRDATNELSYCLLYTSDAADDLLCVDLGGRRIIKKKHDKEQHNGSVCTTSTHHTTLFSYRHCNSNCVYLTHRS